MFVLISRTFYRFAAYWKDPYNYTTYLEKSIFLADINNERSTKNSTYKSNMVSLNALGLLYSTIDTIVIPKTSPWFETFALNQSTDVIPLKKSEAYLSDFLGLRTLDESNRLHLFGANCTHQNLPRDICKPFYDEFTRPLLNNTLMFTN